MFHTYKFITKGFQHTIRSQYHIVHIPAYRLCRFAALHFRKLFNGFIEFVSTNGTFTLFFLRRYITGESVVEQRLQQMFRFNIWIALLLKAQSAEPSQSLPGL